MPPHLCFRFLDNSNYETALRPPKPLKQRRLNSRARKGRLNSTARKNRFNSTVRKNRFNSTARKNRPRLQRAPQNISPISIAYSSVSGVSGLPTYEMSRRQYFPISPLYLSHPPDGSLNGDAETLLPSWSPAYDRTTGAERAEKHEDTTADIDHAFEEVSMALANLTQITDTAQARQDGVAATDYASAASQSPRSQDPVGISMNSDSSSYTSSYSSSFTVSPSYHQRTLPNSPTAWVSMITALSQEQDAAGVSPEDFSPGRDSKADTAISSIHTASHTNTTITSAVEHVNAPTKVAYHPQLQTTLMSPVGLWTRLRASQRANQPQVENQQDKSMVLEVEREKLDKSDTEPDLPQYQSPRLREGSEDACGQREAHCFGWRAR
ncbi:hypothetical protein NQ176_g9623 [Zarea fungicola]|uniref:Uncharacterized protein n=1 Tax=Zarea fungicola TaxID=93591 RepID=A0ACC1MKJ3_9HYPO|nr:hypothetical protein NQ176_g9623 [Lecanicillium fungicola]